MFLGIPGEFLHKGEYTRPSLILRKHYVNLIRLMTVKSYRLTLGSELLANGLITFHCYQSSVTDTGDCLLEELRPLLVFEPFINFHKIINILENVDGFQYIAEKMKHDLEQPVFSSDSPKSKDDWS